MATRTQALADAKRLKAIMQKWGVRCSVELQAGRSGLWMVTKYMRVWHHTVSRYSSGGAKTPVLALVKTGRSDVPGPLANGYIGYDLVFRIVTLGLANHPGRGGPVTIDGVHIPRDSARAPTFGIEVEGGYQRWEDIPGMLETMGRADCALAEWMGRPLTSQMEHLTWAPTRKIDRLGFTRARGIELSRRWSRSPQEDDMSFTTEDRQMLRELHLGRNHKRYGSHYIRDNVLPLLSQDRLTLIGIVAGRYVRDEDPDGPVDVDQLATQVAGAVVEALPAALSGLTPEAIADAVVEALPEDLARQVVADIGARLSEDDES